MRWVTTLEVNNFVPKLSKLSTASVKVVGRVKCVQRPGLFSTGVYP